MTLSSLLPPPNPLAAAQALRTALGGAYPLRDCRGALARCDGDKQAAVAWLTGGAWRAGKLVSWDHAQVEARAEALSTELALPLAQVRTILMNCAASKDLARKVLTGRPLLG